MLLIELLSKQKYSSHSQRNSHDKMSNTRFADSFTSMDAWSSWVLACRNCMSSADSLVLLLHPPMAQIWVASHHTVLTALSHSLLVDNNCGATGVWSAVHDVMSHGITDQSEALIDTTDQSDASIVTIGQWEERPMWCQCQCPGPYSTMWARRVSTLATHQALVSSACQPDLSRLACLHYQCDALLSLGNCQTTSSLICWTLSLYCFTQH